MTRWVDDDALSRLVHGREVALVAPGCTLDLVPQAARDSRIDEHEVVARANGPWPLEPRHAPSYGTRTDLLWLGGKRMFLRDKDKSRALTHGLKLLSIYPIRRRQMRRRHRRLEVGCPVRWCQKINEHFRDMFYRYELPWLRICPTTGMVALLEILLCGPTQLTLIGFTFYRKYKGHPYHYARQYHRAKTHRKASDFGRRDQGERRPHSLSAEFNLVQALVDDRQVVPDEPLRWLCEAYR